MTKPNDPNLTKPDDQLCDIIGFLRINDSESMILNHSRQKKENHRL